MSAQECTREFGTGIIFYLSEVITFNIRTHGGFNKTDNAYIVCLGVQTGINWLVLIAWFVTSIPKIGEDNVKSLLKKANFTIIGCVAIWVVLLVLNIVLSSKGDWTRWFNTAIDFGGYAFLIAFWTSKKRVDLSTTFPLGVFHVAFWISILVANFLAESHENEFGVAYMYTIIENIFLFEILHLVWEAVYDGGEKSKEEHKLI